MRANLLSKLRPPPLVHAWDFWHDRQNRNKESSSSSSSATTSNSKNNDSNKPQNPEFPNESKLSATARQSLDEHKYEQRLVRLAEVADVRAFWEVFNNFDVGALALRDSVHLFHRGIKPVWEDARNASGGAWTFRVPKERARDFWKEVCMLAIGERLQAAVASDRKTFVDDICGVSLSVRFTSILVQIWNRDAKHEAGVARVLETVLRDLSPELRPREGSYYYKAHAEHAGFNQSAAPSGEFAANRPESQSAEASRMAVETAAATSRPALSQATGSGQAGSQRPARVSYMHDNTTHERQEGDLTMPLNSSRADQMNGSSRGGSLGKAEEGGTVPQGGGFIGQEEAVADVREGLSGMREAMDKVEAKHEGVQKQA